MLHYLLAGVSVFNYGLFYWGVAKFFKKKGELNLANYNLLAGGTVLTWVVNTVCILTAPNRLDFIIAGLILQLVSTFIFLQAKNAAKKFELSLVFSDDKPKGLLKTGPYRFVRHPFYSSYLTCYLGAALGSSSIYGYLCFVLMLGIYLLAAGTEEAKFADSPLAKQYAEYRAQTGKFLPNPFKFFFRPQID